jgi:hypothetical protein
MPIYLLFVAGHMLSDLILNIKLNSNIFLNDISISQRGTRFLDSSDILEILARKKPLI